MSVLEDSSKRNHSKTGFDKTENLTPEMYMSLKKIAERQMASQPMLTVLQPTILVHEAWLKLSDKKRDWKDPKHFFAAATTTMRNILIDYIRRKQRIKHGGDKIKETPEALDLVSADLTNNNILTINEGITELEKVHPERAQIVIARFFGGLSHKEISKELGISERTVDRHWAAAKVWLYRWMKMIQTQC